MELSKLHKVYFIGIGGIGMSALARFFASKGLSVYGYDKTPSIITDSLSNLGVSITFNDIDYVIPEEVKEDKGTLIIYTPAIPLGNRMMDYFEDNSYTIMKRSEVLGLISSNSFCLAVAGTHGKTTTSALLGHIMAECNTGASSIIGGIMTNYNSNLILGDKDVVVVEADEFDRSFMELLPNISCITSTDADHLDIYRESEVLEKTFVDFANLLPVDGKIICKDGLSVGDNAITYSIDGDSDYVATNIRVEAGKFIFNLIDDKGDLFENIYSNLPGRYNIENTLAAFAMAAQYGLKPTNIIDAIHSFKGIYRRFNIFESRGKIIVDDYAHHPSELEASLEAARELYPSKKIAVIFQPHLYSRTRDFEYDFAKVLSKFDALRLLDIYPAREQPIEGVSSSILLDKIDNLDKKLISKEDIEKEIQNKNIDVFMMLGAGDISVEIEKIKKL